MIRWIDRSPETLAKQEASMKKDREERTEEEVDRKLLQDQIELAAQAASSISSAPEDTNQHDLVRQHDAPVKLEFKGFMKPIKKFEPKKLNALASSSGVAKTTGFGEKRKLTVAEQIIQESKRPRK